jgi:hypothetical protein
LYLNIFLSISYFYFSYTPPFFTPLKFLCSNAEITSYMRRVVCSIIVYCTCTTADNVLYVPLLLSRGTTSLGPGRTLTTITCLACAGRLQPLMMCLVCVGALKMVDPMHRLSVAYCWSPRSQVETTGDGGGACDWLVHLQPAHAVSFIGGTAHQLRAFWSAIDTAHAGDGIPLWV